MFDTFRPALTPAAKSRTRSDGSVGIHDPQTAREAEIAADQATLATLIDGKRTVAEIAEAHVAKHQFVPFVALRDLFAKLSAERLLAAEGDDVARAGLSTRRPFLQRASGVRIAKFPFGAALAIVLSLGALALAVLQLLRPVEPPPLSPWDVLWAYVGASAALSSRGAFKALAVLIFGGSVRTSEVNVTLGVLHLEPDSGGLVLLDRPKRVFVYLAGLAGAALALSTERFAPGLAAGALCVLIADLCPFAPTSAGKLLAALAGKVDLREHARAYLSQRLLRRVAAKTLFAGEVSLLTSALLSLAWIGLIVRLLLTTGVTTVLHLVAVGVDHVGLERGLAYAGALLLLLMIPGSLLLLVMSLVRAVLSLRPAEKAQEGRRGAGTVETADLASIPLFSRLPPEDLSALAGAAEERSYEPRQKIVAQGETGDRFFALKRGRVAVEVQTDSGLVTEVARLSAGDCFGEIALLERRPRTATVRALEPTVCTVISHDAFKKLRQSVGDQVTNVIRSTTALNRSPLFSQLPTERRSALALRLKPVEVRAGQTVVREGEPGDSFFLVAQGEMEVVAQSGERLSTLRAGDHFGEVALLRNVPRTATVKAVADGVLLSLNKNDFLGALAKDLNVSTQFEELAASRLEDRR